MLPIYLKDQDFAPPEDPLYYLLTRDGLFLAKSTPFFSATVPVNGVPWLEPQEPVVRLTASPLPATLLLRALAFFRAVYQRYRAEAVVLLAWRESGRSYELIIPPQTVGGGHCDYETKDFPAGLIRLGTIHSHAGGEAFHSERDWFDERFEDGFHLTLGNVGEALPTLACSVVVQGFRGEIPPENLFSQYPIPWDQTPAPETWNDEVSAKVTPLPKPIEFGT